MKVHLPGRKQFLGLMLLLVLLSQQILVQSCTVEGCARCKDGSTTACATCKTDGFEEEFIRDSNGQVRLTCKKANSTGMIIGIVLGVCGFFLCVALILLFYWVHLKRLIKKNVSFFSSKREELLQKRTTYEEQRQAHGSEISAYVRQRTEYERIVREANEARARADEAERLRREEELRRMQAPTPPPMYNIFVEMEKDYINRQRELQNAQSLRLPPGFLQKNPIPPPIEPLTPFDTFTPTPYGVSHDVYGHVPNSNAVAPAPVPYQMAQFHSAKQP